MHDWSHSCLSNLWRIGSIPPFVIAFLLTLFRLYFLFIYFSLSYERDATKFLNDVDRAATMAESLMWTFVHHTTASFGYAKCYSIKLTKRKNCDMGFIIYITKRKRRERLTWNMDLIFRSWFSSLLYHDDFRLCLVHGQKGKYKRKMIKWGS